jgi:hypothetical protein
MPKSKISAAEQAITTPEHKPKALVKGFLAAFKSAKIPATLVKAEATLPRNWDYGVLIIFEIPGQDEQVVFSINAQVTGDRKEASGTVSLARVGSLGQVLDTQRGVDPVAIAKKLVATAVDRLRPPKAENRSIIRDMVYILESL